MKGDPRKFFNQDFKCNFDSDKLKEINKGLERIPKIDLKYTIVAVDDKNEPLENQSLQEGGEAMIVVNLKRLNKAVK